MIRHLFKAGAVLGLGLIAAFELVAKAAARRRRRREQRGRRR